MWKKVKKMLFYGANTLRKALLTNSPVACSVMGKMLACHANQRSIYDQDDNIIFHALESATDDDIRTFMIIMQEYKTSKGSFRIPLDELDASKLATIGWCEANRLFYGPGGGITFGDSGDNQVDTSHSPTSAAERLFEYVDSVKQLLGYKK